MNDYNDEYNLGKNCFDGVTFLLMKKLTLSVVNTNGNK